MTKQIDLTDIDEYDIKTDNEIVFGKFGNVKLPYDKIETIIQTIMVKFKSDKSIGFKLNEFVEILNKNGVSYEMVDKNNRQKRLGNVVQTFRNAYKNELFAFKTHSHRGEYIVFEKSV